MRSLLLATAALALAGCADLKPVKAYTGADRPDAELAILQSEFVRDLHKSSDIEIDVLDGVNYGQRKYAAKMLPGKHRAGLRQRYRLAEPARAGECRLGARYRRP